MTIKAASSTKSYLVIGGLCVAAIAGGSSLAMLTKSSKASAVPNDLTKEALRAQAKETPGQVFEKMRETMQREDLTDEQRQKVRENMREVGREMMEERVNEYFAAATEEEKKAILDRQIDEFMKMREEWEKRREEREKQGEKDGEPSGAIRVPQRRSNGENDGVLLGGTGPRDRARYQDAGARRTRRLRHGRRSRWKRTVTNAA
jgi:hypothetical protein